MSEKQKMAHKDSLKKENVLEKAEDQILLKRTNKRKKGLKKYKKKGVYKLLFFYINLSIESLRIAHYWEFLEMEWHPLYYSFQ